MYVEKDTCFKELTHTTVATGMSEICSIGWQTGDAAIQVDIAVQIQRLDYWQNSLLLGGPPFFLS